MKWLVLLLLMFPFGIHAQENRCKDLSSIAEIEKQAYLTRLNSNMRSNASPNFTVNFYRCTWKIDPAVRYIDGKVAVHFTTTSPTNSINFDLVNTLTVDSVIFRNQKIGFSQAINPVLSIQLPIGLDAQQKDSVSIFYHGVPGTTGGFGSFVQTDHSGTPIIWTLSEPYGSLDWWPCRNGLDDKADSLDVTIIHPSQYKSTSNGLLQSETTIGNTTTTFFKHRYPIASYLVAIAVTNYARFNNTVQLGGTSLAVESYVYPEHIQYFQPLFYQVSDALQLFHNSFGPYPFIKEKYGQTQFGWGGGMEHQTNSFVTTNDNGLMAHELGHQWFGNKITCGSWQDIWLNEGFATFASNYYFEKFDTTAYRLTMINHLADIVSQPGGSVFIKDTTNINTLFSNRLSYQKGAFVLRMLRFTLGDSLFFKGVQQYLTDPLLSYGFARIADFRRNMEQVCKMDLGYFFNQWIYGEGYPSFTVEWSQNKNNWANIKVSQTTAHASVAFFKTPLALTFKKGTQQKTVTVQCNVNNDISWADIGFVADTVLVDKDLQLISKNNKTIKLAASSSDQNDIKVYPNPVSTQVAISIKNPSEKKLLVQLFNAAGQLLFKKNIDTPGQDELISIPFSNYQHGVYLLKLTVGSSINLVRKIFK